MIATKNGIIAIILINPHRDNGCKQYLNIRTNPIPAQEINEMIKSMTIKDRLIIPITLFSMMILTLSGCSMSNYGRLTSTPEIKKAFETYQVLPNHEYYYRGVSSKPTVIVGINDNYELNLTMWVQIDTESEDFRRLINIVSLQGMGTTVDPWGFRILDNAGDDVGVWYSAIRAAAIAINENRQIVKLQPGTMVAVGDQLK